MKSSAMSSEELDTLLAGDLGGRFPRTTQISSHRRLRRRNRQLAELPMNADLERLFRPVVIRAARGQVETEVPLSVPRWPRAVR
jgi:hypothetical protein